jgi:hypothetical protein
MRREPGRAGYTIFAEDGGVFCKGSQVHYGSAVGVVSGIIVGADVTPSGNGYILISSTGGVYAFGDASYRGGGANGARDILHTATGLGYWIVHSDGSIYSYGDATYYGNAP